MTVIQQLSLRELMNEERRRWRIPPHKYELVFFRFADLRKEIKANSRYGALEAGELVSSMADVGTPKHGFIRYRQFERKSSAFVDVAYRCNPGKHFVIGPPRLGHVMHDDWEKLTYKCGHCTRTLYELFSERN